MNQKILFKPEWIDKAIADWEATAVLDRYDWGKAYDMHTDDGLCRYFRKSFGYSIGSVFQDIGYSRYAYIWPSNNSYSKHATTWEEHARPRINFLKRMRNELVKLGYL